MTTLTKSDFLSEFSALFAQLSELKQKELISFIRNFVNGENSAQVEVAEKTNFVSVYDFCKNQNPIVAEIDLEIEPRSKQKSRKEIEL